MNISAPVPPVVQSETDFHADRQESDASFDLSESREPESINTEAAESIDAEQEQTFSVEEDNTDEDLFSGHRGFLFFRRKR